MAERKIALIGAGNVATHLGVSLKTANYSIIQVCSKTKSSAEELAHKLDADVCTDIKSLSSDADIYIISVPDDQIEIVTQNIQLENKIVVHTSGSVDLNVFSGSANNYGVFYPLQTFSKEKPVIMQEVPICLEASNKETFQELEQIANSISKHVYAIKSDQRAQIHIAAVFACNFTNHLYAIADLLLQEKNIPLDILGPLIKETAEKALNNPPAAVQTGPAVRGDLKVLEKHLNSIKNVQHKEIYKLISESISNQES